MDKILRLNMRDQTISCETADEKYQYVGGRYFTSMKLNEEVPPTCEPLGRHNKLVIAPGLLAGTAAPTSSRISVGAKSPLTGGIKESNAGGSFARKLGSLGYKGVIVEEKPHKDEKGWYMLLIDKDGAHLESAGEYAGLDNYDACGLLRKRFGEQAGIMIIGVAGERQYSTASCAVADDDGIPCRHAGRGGMGAVMGSKRLKCIIVDATGAPDAKYVDREKFTAHSTEWYKELVAPRKGLTQYGTVANIQAMSQIGALAVRNFSLGSYEDYEKINHETIYNLIMERGGNPSHACYKGCAIRCSNVYNGPDGKHLTSSLEFETTALFGANLCISDIDTVAGLDRFCDGFGMDTMEMGATFGVAMEAGLCQFGDIKGVWKMVEEIKNDTVFGKALVHGCTVAGKILGVLEVPAVKGQSLAGFDPRTIKGLGVTYATSPMGGDHTFGNCLPGRPGYRECNQNPPPTTQKEGQAEWSKDMQILVAVCDAMGFCMLAVGGVLATAEHSAQLLSFKFGKEFTTDDMIQMGKKMIMQEVEFNRRAGFGDGQNRIPEFIMETPLASNGEVYDVPQSELQNFHYSGFEVTA